MAELLQNLYIFLYPSSFLAFAAPEAEKYFSKLTQLRAHAGKCILYPSCEIRLIFVLILARNSGTERG